MAENDVTRKCDGGRQTPASEDEQNCRTLDGGSDGSRDGSRDSSRDGSNGSRDGSMTDESVNTRSSTKRSGRGRGEVTCYTDR